MTNKERCLEDWKFRTAVVLTRMLNNRMQYRISPHPVTEGQVPRGGYMSNWCYTEERAWHAALCRRWTKVWSSDFGEGY
jgi:hypothetical protein